MFGFFKSSPPHKNASMKDMSQLVMSLLNAYNKQGKISNKDALSPEEIHGKFSWPWTPNKKAPVVHSSGALKSFNVVDELMKAQESKRVILTDSQKHKIRVAFNTCKEKPNSMGHELTLDEIVQILEMPCQPSANDVVSWETEGLLKGIDRKGHDGRTPEGGTESLKELNKVWAPNLTPGSPSLTPVSCPFRSPPVSQSSAYLNVLFRGTPGTNGSPLKDPMGDSSLSPMTVSRTSMGSSSSGGARYSGSSSTCGSEVSYPPYPAVG